MNEKITLFWFRRDLRLTDNHGLFKALTSGYLVLPIFIFDTDILNKLEDKTDARVSFIHSTLISLNESLSEYGSGLKVYHGNPLESFRNITEQYNVAQVITNHDYEPSAIKRDLEIEAFLKEKGIQFVTYKDQVIFEKNEVMKSDGTPYKVFTPYSRKWKENFAQRPLEKFTTEKHFHNFLKVQSSTIISLSQLGFERSGIIYQLPKADTEVLEQYHNTRDNLFEQGTTRISTALRFGVVSIREWITLGDRYNPTFLNELIWREFYMMILFHYPHVVHSAFKKEYDRIEWNNDEAHFVKWCQGKTGIPVVDAGMRELNQTGYMHNRARMIVASFLTKNLQIDYKWGEEYFASKLLDFELASNNGGWQWAAGTGCDAAPYFRIFNPITQAKRFDPNEVYINKWVKEYKTSKYAQPIIDLKESRDKALKMYKNALS